VKKVQYLLVTAYLVGKKVLHRVNVIMVPLELKSRRVLRATNTRLSWLPPKEGPVKKIINLLVVDLHE
jgi:hypothetical protein